MQHQEGSRLLSGNLYLPILRTLARRPQEIEDASLYRAERVSEIDGNARAYFEAEAEEYAELVRTTPHSR